MNFKEQVIQAIDALEKQGKFSKKPDSSVRCWYLDTDTGNCCIVGHMMPSNELRRKMDSLPSDSGITSLWEIRADPWVTQFTKDQIYTLSQLQYLHDTFDDFEEAIIEMRNLADTL